MINIRIEHQPNIPEKTNWGFGQILNDDMLQSHYNFTELSSLDEDIYSSASGDPETFSSSFKTMQEKAYKHGNATLNHQGKWINIELYLSYSNPHFYNWTLLSKISKASELLDVSLVFAVDTAKSERYATKWKDMINYMINTYSIAHYSTGRSNYIKLNRK